MLNGQKRLAAFSLFIADVVRLLGCGNFRYMKRIDKCKSPQPGQGS